MSNFVIPHAHVVELSEAAITHFANIANGKIVRFSIEGGSCAGHKYVWQIIDSIEKLYPDDEITEYKDFTFAVDGVSIVFVIGCYIDYLTDITGSRLEITNPNATASCGCGESVSFM